ncbi:efflux transporter outer membrane subunit [Candidatus Protochlamydia amoebophila]|uniref:Uncharacterized protein n=1 Tax=Protochlamydia amoebophila (strain UWE25) TaxID=264201 RepID=A0A2P9H9I3_PARUW|nr:efflux transporter outer membrane subunit [Candidatus Protochlamydia amoebophila]SPJ31658.1 unnamed protein product [Candidatus Protochlamydia amoebophila UWE25]
MFRILVTSCLLLALSSCVLHPPYQQPCLEIPKKWRTPFEETSTAANFRWWEAFDDPILKKLIFESLENNKDLKLALARTAEFKARLGIVRSQFFPQISGVGLASRQRTPTELSGGKTSSGVSSQGQPGLTPVGTNLIPSPYTNNYRVVAEAAYELDLWGRVYSSSEAALADLLGQVQARRALVLSIVSSVATSYIQMRQFDQQLIVSKQTVTSRKESYELAKLRFEGGLTSELEVKQAAAEVDEAIAEVFRLEVLIPQQENLISILIGHSPREIERGLNINEWPTPLAVPAGLPSELLEQRPDIIQAEQGLIAANARIGEARAQYFPSISLTGYFGSESLQLHHLFTSPTRAWQYAANLLQPIFTGGKISSGIDVAKAQKRIAYYNYQQTVLNAFKEVDNALIAHQKSRELLEVQKNSVVVLKDYLHLAKLQYDNGQTDYLNVLDAERKLFTAQLNLAQAEADVFLTLVNVYKVLGGGWVIDAENLSKEKQECL